MRYQAVTPKATIRRLLTYAAWALAIVGVIFGVTVVCMYLVHVALIIAHNAVDAQGCWHCMRAK